MESRPSSASGSRHPKEVIRTLNEAFLENPYPDQAVMDDLATATALSHHQVNTWFRNTRSRKCKRDDSSIEGTYSNGAYSCSTLSANIYQFTVDPNVEALAQSQSFRMSQLQLGEEGPQSVKRCQPPHRAVPLRLLSPNAVKRFSAAGLDADENAIFRFQPRSIPLRDHGGAWTMHPRTIQNRKSNISVPSVIRRFRKVLGDATKRRNIFPKATGFVLAEGGACDVLQEMLINACSVANRTLQTVTSTLVIASLNVLPDLMTNVNFRGKTISSNILKIFTKQIYRRPS